MNYKKIIILGIIPIIILFFFFLNKKDKKNEVYKSDEDNLLDNTNNTSSNNGTSSSSNSNNGTNTTSNNNICKSDVGKFTFNWWKTSDVLTTAQLNLKEAPTINSAVILTLNEREPLTMLNQADNWAYVKTKSGKTGYVCKKYLTLYGDKAEGMLGDLEINRNQPDGNWHSFNQQNIL